MTLQPEKLFSFTLEQLGYGSIDESSGKTIPSCDWLFEKEETKELLIWLCNNLRRSNVLTNEELKRYQELEAQGLTLEGDQLEDALGTMKSIDNRQDMDSLTQEVANLQLELTKATNQLSYMASDRAKIATQHAKLTHRSAGLATYNSKLQEVAETLQQKLMNTVNEAKDALKSTEVSVSELASLHEKPAPNQDAAFLSHMPFDSYLEAEKSLVKQIDEDLISSEQRDTKDAISQYSFLGVTEIPQALLKVEPENTRNAFASELSRLRLHYEKSIMLELDAQMQEAKIPAEEEALREWDEAFEHLSQEDLTNQLIATQEGLASAGQTMRTHLTQSVPQLARTLAQLSVLPVLETDLKEQVEFVQETIDTQLQAITNLSHQKSRLDFLKGNLLYEETQHTQSHTLIEAAIQGAKNSIGKTINSQAAPPPPSTIVDLNVPSSLTRAHTMLERFSPTALSIVTKDTIASAASNVSQSISLANNEKEIAIKERETMLSQLLSNISSLNSVLFAPHSNLQPQLANTELVTTNEQLEKLLKILERMLTDVLKFRQTKVEEMRYWGAERSQERDIFIYFFNNPDKLLAMYEELKQRVEASKITS